MANLCHPHEMTELVDRFQNWRGFECPYCLIAKLEEANREWALNDAKTRTGWFIEKVAELSKRNRELEVRKEDYDALMAVLQRVDTALGQTSAVLWKSLKTEIKSVIASQSSGGTES